MSSTSHEKLFDEISGKLQELSQKKDQQAKQDQWSERIEKMQNHLRISQEELRVTQSELQEKIKSLDSLSFAQSDLAVETKKLTDQLESERMTNSKLSTDLAKSLELNLKLQFDLEEIRTKANNLVLEERKANQYLTDRNKSVSTELELSQALQNETKIELMKARDRFQGEQAKWLETQKNLEQKINDLQLAKDEDCLRIEKIESTIQDKDQEIQRLNQTLDEFEQHAVKQNEVMKSLSSVAEKKLIELKLSLDKKTIESQEYYGHLQQALTQVQVLRQENAALKDYIAKLTQLHQSRTTEIRA